MLACDVAANAGEIVFRVFLFVQAIGFLLLQIGDLAVRAGTDAEVITKLPVIQIVQRAPCRRRVGRDFITRVAAGLQQGMTGVLNIGQHLVIRQRRRVKCETGIRLDGQLIPGQMRGFQCQRGFQIAQRVGHTLAGQAVHQIEIEIVEAGFDGPFRRAPRFQLAVNATEPLQLRGIEALHANRQAIDAGLAKALELARFGGAGVGLHGDFDIAHEWQQRADTGQQSIHCVRREQRRRAATNENAVDASAPDPRQILLQITQQRVDVLRLRDLAFALMRIEIAIRAFAHTPGDVHVQRQGQRIAELLEHETRRR